MRGFKSIAAFGLIFAVVFGILAAPWPGFRGAFAAVLGNELRLVLKFLLPRETVQIHPLPNPTHGSADTEAAVQAAVGSAGSAEDVRGVDFDSRSLGWMPHAMMLALCLATPMRWKRRWTLAAAGLLTTHVFVLTSLAIIVMNGAMTDSTPGWLQWTLPRANHLVLDNLWFSFVVPLVIWVAGYVWLGNPGEVASTASTSQSGSK